MSSPKQRTEATEETQGPRAIRTSPRALRRDVVHTSARAVPTRRPCIREARFTLSGAPAANPQLPPHTSAPANPLLPPRSSAYRPQERPEGNGRPDRTSRARDVTAPDCTGTRTGRERVRRYKHIRQPTACTHISTKTCARKGKSACYRGCVCPAADRKDRSKPWMPLRVIPRLLLRSKLLFSCS